MKQAIVGYSLYFLVVEPRNTLHFKLFDKCLTLIEIHFSLMQVFTAFKDLKKVLTNKTK